jgi:hypothetical protein
VSAELADGTRVAKPGYGYRGTLVRHEDGRARTRWAVVRWDGLLGTEQVDPRTIEPLVERART